jgi:hypothetical protein
MHVDRTHRARVCLTLCRFVNKLAGHGFSAS